MQRFVPWHGNYVITGSSEEETKKLCELKERYLKLQGEAREIENQLVEYGIKPNEVGRIRTRYEMIVELSIPASELSIYLEELASELKKQ